MFLPIIERLTIRLIQSNPFFASLLSQCRKIEVTGDLAKQIPTEAVSIENGRINFYYNPQFLETLTLDEAAAVLHHEMKHLVLNHCTRMKQEFKDNPKIANLASDINANRHLQNLPKDCITINSFPKDWGLKEDDTSENYYDTLVKNSNKMSIEQNSDGSYTLTIKDSKGNVIKKIKVKVIDSHDKWADSDSDIPELAKEVLRQAIKEAHDQTMKQRGTIPEDIEQIVKEWLKPPVISWRVLLKQFIAASIKSGHKRSWKRPNRRFGETQKGKLSDHTISMTIAIDTSGSISTEDFISFMSEIKEIQACYKGTVTVLECDAEIKKEYKLTKYKKLDTKFAGRGGTSFLPVFKYIKEKQIKTDALLYFTDGYGDQEQCKKPGYPVLWICTQDNMEVPFGKVISLTKNPDGRKKDKLGR